MVLLQEQSLYSLGEPTVPAGECRSRDGMPALHCLWASQWALILINGNPQSPAHKHSWNGEAAQRGLSLVPQDNLIVTKHAPELIWVTKLSQHTAGRSITHFPLASLTHLPLEEPGKQPGTWSHILVTFTAKEDFHLMLNTHSLPSLHFFAAKRAAWLYPSH